MPRVSVVINSYNHEKYIFDTIQSVLHQTYKDFEIIITDDGSVDETVSEIMRITDKRLMLFTFEKNQGACVAVNNCIKNSSGEFIAILSSDDMFHQDKLRKQVEFLTNHRDIGAVFGLAEIIDANGKTYSYKKHVMGDVFRKQNRTRYEWLNYFFYHGNCLCHPTVLVRKECYDKIGLYDERYAALPDLDFWIRFCMRFSIHIMQEKLIGFRWSGDNASGFKTENLRRGFWEFKNILRHYLNIKKLDEFKKVFPEIKSADYARFIPFLVAKLALEVNDIAHYFFGIDTLMELLGDPSYVNHLESEKYFSYIDLVKRTGESSVYLSQMTMHNSLKRIALFAKQVVSSIIDNMRKNR